jgi:hypothetical protein
MKRYKLVPNTIDPGSCKPCAFDHDMNRCAAYDKIKSCINHEIKPPNKNRYYIYILDSLNLNQQIKII